MVSTVVKGCSGLPGQLVMVAAHEVMVRVVVWVTVEVVRGAEEAPLPEGPTEPVAETEAVTETEALVDETAEVELAMEEVLLSSSHPGNSVVVV